MSIKEAISNIIEEEIGSDAAYSLERNEAGGRGDYSSNIAFSRAKLEKRAPMELAEEYAVKLRAAGGGVFHSVEAAHPGFLNFTIKPEYLYEALRGSLCAGKKESSGRASVEFISANPTGPLHIGNARGGPIGDTVARVLEEYGYKVTREYFYNDAGAQMQKFGDSLWYWYLRARGIKTEFPEGGYECEYVKEIGDGAYKKWKGKLTDGPDGKQKLVAMALARLDAGNAAVIKKMGIKFDKITKDSDLLKLKTKKAVQELRIQGMLKEKDGALWYAPNDEYLGDRETVIAKKDGTYLYFANDIAYHKEKFSKNDIVVDVLGEGHHGHIPKLRSIANAFGFSNKNFKIIVHGQVNLVKNGKPYSMSKRKGNFVTAGEVLEEVGVDAFRFFMLQYSPHSGMTFDLSLARERSKKNPVYYVQYAHARAAGILNKAPAGLRKKTDPRKADLFLLDTLPELALIKQILAFDEVVEETARDFEVQRLAHYAYELARAFTSFYETAKVIGAESDVELSRLALVFVAKHALVKILGLLGISAPDKM